MANPARSLLHLTPRALLSLLLAFPIYQGCAERGAIEGDGEAQAAGGAEQEGEGEGAGSGVAVAKGGGGQGVGGIQTGGQAAGGSQGGGQVLCTPGQQLECACPGGGVTGAQACLPDGSGFGACEGCQQTGAGGSPSAQGGMPGNTAGQTSSQAGMTAQGGSTSPFGGGGMAQGTAGSGNSAQGGMGNSGQGTAGMSQGTAGMTQGTAGMSQGTAGMTQGSAGSSSGCGMVGCATTGGSMAGCQGAATIGRVEAAGGYLVGGSTCNVPASVQADGCSDIGNDRSYRVFLRAGDSVTFTVTQTAACDGGSVWQSSLSLYGSSGCDDMGCGSMIECRDDPVVGKGSISYTASKDRWVVFVVDGFVAEGQGDYELSVKLTCADPGCGC